MSALGAITMQTKRPLWAITLIELQCTYTYFIIQLQFQLILIVLCMIFNLGTPYYWVTPLHLHTRAVRCNVSVSGFLNHNEECKTKFLRVDQSEINFEQIDQDHFLLSFSTAFAWLKSKILCVPLTCMICHINCLIIDQNAFFKRPRNLKKCPKLMYGYKNTDWREYHGCTKFCDVENGFFNTNHLFYPLRHV